MEGRQGHTRSVFLSRKGKQLHLPRKAAKTCDGPWGPPSAWPVSRLSHLMVATASSCELPSVFKGQFKCHCFLKPWLPPLRHSTRVYWATPACSATTKPPRPLSLLPGMLVLPHHLSRSSLSFSSQLQQHLLREDPPVQSPPPSPSPLTLHLFFCPLQHIPLFQCGLPASPLHLTLSQRPMRAEAVSFSFTTALLARHLARVGCSDLFFQ